MGGVAKFMPLTYAAMMIGTIAIIGLGIPHTSLGFAGFFSKDAILETAFAAGEAGVTFGMMAFIFGIVAALLTSFYSWRLIYMTFHGPREDSIPPETPEFDSHADEHLSVDEHGHHHHDEDPHESPLVMLIPLGLLSLGAIFAGFLFYDPMVGHDQGTFWAGAIYTATDNTLLADKYNVPGWVFWAPLFVTVTGFLIATFTYLFNRGFGAKIAASGGPLHSLFANKWYFDEIYNATFVKATYWLGGFFWKTGDKRIIDGLGPDGVTSLVRWGSRRLSAMHTGYLYHYAFVIIGAALVFGAVIFWRVGGAG